MSGASTPPTLQLCPSFLLRPASNCGLTKDLQVFMVAELARCQADVLVFSLHHWLRHRHRECISARVDVESLVSGELDQFPSFDGGGRSHPGWRSR